MSGDGRYLESLLDEMPDLGGLVGENVFAESAGRLMIMVSSSQLLAKGSFLLILGDAGPGSGRMPTARSCPRAWASWWRSR